MPAAVAAIDCGTNSTRLLVAGPDATPLARLMTITRLGAGVDRTRRLDPSAIERTVAVLRGYREVMDRHGVGPVRMTATSAARDAVNRDEFFAAARDAIGTLPELLGGDAEGRLSFAGAIAELDPSDGPWLVADIGGGSTELASGPVAGDRLRPVAVRSIDMGCVRITERFLASDPPAPAERRAAAAFVAAELERATREQPELGGARHLVGLAGTVSAAVGLADRADHYDRAKVHHRTLEADVVTGLLEELSALDDAGRRVRPGMEVERSGVIVGGLIVLDGLMRHLGVRSCLVSESDILDGLARSLLGS